MDIIVSGSLSVVVYYRAITTITRDYQGQENSAKLGT